MLRAKAFDINAPRIFNKVAAKRPRHAPISFDRVMMPRFTKEATASIGFATDLSQILADNAIADMCAEADGAIGESVGAIISRTTEGAYHVQPLTR